MKKLAVFLLLMLVLMILSACSNEMKLDGTYNAIDLPATEDTLVETITFKGNDLTLKGKYSSQTLQYTISDGNIQFDTKYGSFAYPITINPNNLIIDGITYARQSD